jgi:hypothetical protein
LTTTLAHASGEWIASDWPVCPIAETANPQRMGAALTYARRYALFTLVGIAGEDDIDAPDLCAGPTSLSSPTELDGALQLGHGNSSRRNAGNAHGRGATKSETRVVLDPAQSAKLRDKLLLEVENIASSDLAATWAAQALVAKNNLIASDARLVEEAFERRLSALPLSDGAVPASDRSSVPQIDGLQKTVTSENIDADRGRGIDKSILTIAAPRRYRNREHLRYVAQQACLVCGRKPSDPHHLGFTQPRALSRKVSDEFAVPLCRGHHRAVHRSRDERAWWRQANIDPIKVARRLWKETHGMRPRRSQRAALPPPYGNAASSDPKNENITATATTQEETRLPGLPS